MNFSDLGLSKDLLSSIERAKYESPYPIQIEAIPAILQQKDILGLAPTGSGKTAAYILPILQRLLPKEAPRERFIPVLVIVPTRELAVQVAEVTENFSRFLPRKIKSMAVFGGVSINPQMMKLHGVEILIATPGRLIDLLGRNALGISRIHTLVLDEADKVLNMGFREEVEHILELLPSRRQNILFSATTDNEVDVLIQKLLKDPVRIQVEGDNFTPDLIDQKAYRVSPENKGPFLRQLINSGDWSQILVFASSIRTADNVATKLSKNGIEAVAFHGDKSQGARTEALARFKSGKTRVLVATDLAARGIDIQFLPLVINYELPRSPKDYIHRIGRTGRAGATGEAISLITPEELHHFKVIQKKMGKRVLLLESENFGKNEEDS
ncbi:MAG: DEAD/DEAH box helicase [Algoriphagus sp.]|uniref:DEAD/DEAH box helicase n=1 Tax=Algoriphagus sp. TaxID=1872435 RepID=UPI002726FC25|nr:DEAD/DEAH box helicase [Algoriphagus sp.]MDO8968668.1 DEAD/DEAH box helicase [Algoriphagus sp.]MDP2039757.1 DEAD/DEAH box helicase [Algoriphagus sp.]MDP3200310.1 DEAD/DEAH box helicase [Algoriphagus sp.]MDP3474059.1 DEAD/DEAH box helicase [Algoriphagus sp.]